MSKLTKLAAATILALGTSSAMADDNRYIIQVDTAHKGVVKALARQMGGDIKVDANGFIAASFEGKSLSEVKGLLNNPHIKLVEADVRRIPLSIYSDDSGNPLTTELTPYALYQSQAVGAGLSLDMNNAKKVCVIDSGLALSQGETGGANPDMLDHGNITGSNDSGTGNWNSDGGPHGTHVAGTVAAPANGFGVVGFAPGNPLHIVKVFNDAGWGYSSDLAKAAQECTNGGAKIITMSLGGGGANSTEENAFNTFTSNGGLVLAAAGNDGNTTRSYPAGYASVMMIGANDANNNIASFSQYPSITSRVKGQTISNENIGVEVTVGGVDTLSTYPSGGTSLVTASADSTAFAAAPSDNGGSLNGATHFMGTAETATPGAASNKICLIDRGNISFADKINNCAASGGIGALVINNVAGEGPIYMDVTGVNTNIPAYGAALESRTTILAASNVSISSSASDYGYMSGTSMATPGAAGAAALIWSNHPNCSGTEIRNAMKATAEDQGTAGRDDYFGYGIVKAAAASAHIDANACTGDTGPVEPPKPCKGRNCK